MSVIKFTNGKFPVLNINGTKKLMNLPLNTVTIGGRSYPTVTIGNQIWMAENLDWKFDINGSQIPIGGGSVGTPAAWYLDNDENAYGVNGQRRGLLYNGYANSYLITYTETMLPDGWRVPSVNDFNILIQNNTVSSLLSEGGIGYGDWQGTNTTGFNCKPTGWCEGSVFHENNTLALMWTSTNSNGKYFTTTTVRQYMHYSNRGGAIRLVKDVT